MSDHPLRNRVLAGALPVAILLAGCAPKINEFTIADGEPGEALAVAASVTKNQTTIQGVELDVGPAGGVLDPAGSLAGGGGQYQGVTPRLGPGDYEARVRVLYKAVFQSAVKTKSATRTFTLGWPGGTFSFETGGLNNWSIGGVYGVSPDFDGCDLATLQQPPHFSYSTSGWPLLIGDVNQSFVSGSLRALVGATCYPDSDSEVPANGLWNFNFLSPELTGDDDWQGINGVSFRLATNAPFGVQAVATVIYLDENGEPQPTSPMTGPNQVDFTQVTAGDQWLTIEKTWNIPDRPIRSVEIRVFGDPESIAGSAGSTVLLDVVTPLN